MWASNQILELSFAIVNFETSEITWKPAGFSPRRHKAIQSAFGRKIVVVAELENIF